MTVALIETGEDFTSVTLHSSTPAAEKYRDDLLDVFKNGDRLTYITVEVEDALTDEELKIVSPAAEVVCTSCGTQ